MFLRRAFCSAAGSSHRSVPLWHQLTSSFETIESLHQSSGRIEKSRILSSTLQEILKTDTKTFPQALRLTLGYFHGKNTLGIGTVAIRNSAAQALNIDPSLIVEQEKEFGDLADAITFLFHQEKNNLHNKEKTQQKKYKNLAIHDISKGLTKLSNISGTDSNIARESLVSDLLCRCESESEVKYLVRTLQGQNKLRIGMGESSIVGAAACAALCNGVTDIKIDSNLAQSPQSSKKQVNSRNDLREVETLGRRMYSARHDLNTFANILVDSYELCLHNDRERAMALCKLHTNPFPLIPVRSMLASPSKSVNEAIAYFTRVEKMGNREIVCQHKYDGERAQIHVVFEGARSSFGGEELNNPTTIMKTRVYSRVGEDYSLRYQHVANRIGELLQLHTQNTDQIITSCILDGEIVAIDRKSGHILPFQSLSRRMRDGSDNNFKKVTSSAKAIQSPTTIPVTSPQLRSLLPPQLSQPCDVCFYVFDLLEYNGQSLVKKSLRERQIILKKMINPVEGELEVCEELKVEIGNTNIDAPIKVYSALEAAVKAGCEGLVVKALDGKESWYKCGERTKNWLKLKKDYVNSVNGALDTFDLVLLAAYHGKGKRQGLYGSFLMGCLDENDGNNFRTICKVGTGFSDSTLKEIHSRLSNADEIQSNSLNISHSKIRPLPDIWFQPSLVWEVRAADISLSKVHDSCLDKLAQQQGHEKGYGLALRFPRFVRFRDDKNIKDATTESQMFSMFEEQTSHQKQ
jgi:DNA ligase 1